MNLFTFSCFQSFRDCDIGWYFKRRLLPGILILCFGIFLIIPFIPEMKTFRRQYMDHTSGNTSVSLWVIRKNGQFRFLPTMGKTDELYSTTRPQLAFTSPFLIDGDESAVTTNKKTWPRSRRPSTVKTVSVFDPQVLYKNLIREDFKHCENTNCKMITDVEKADAVIFVMPKLKTEPNFKRKKNQTWVFFTIEAPSRSAWFSILSRPAFTSAMNLSVTFRLNSDIKNVYGKLIRQREFSDKNYNAIFRNKSKMAAWFVSHCPTRSGRMQFVDRMKTRMDVDVFGRCGTHTCGIDNGTRRSKSARERIDELLCLPMLSSSYKFYFAFENTLCREYVTEKFFKLFQNVDVVPVVRGGADYRKHFPSGMYVDAADFVTPESLADFLVDLAGDRDRYVRYLRNKDGFRLWLDPHRWRCELCAKLHTTDHVTYTDIRDWWTRDSCYDPKDAKGVW